MMPPAEHALPCLGTLVRRLPIRVVDISAVGCLIEAAQPVDAGTVALLALHIGGRRYVDPVRIARSVRLRGAIWAYRLGADLLTLAPPGALTLRRIALLESADLIIPAGSRTTSSASEIGEAETRLDTDAADVGVWRSSD